MSETAWEDRERYLHEIARRQKDLTEEQIKMLFFWEFRSYLIAPGKSVFLRLEELVQEGVFVFKDEHYAVVETKYPQ